MSRIRSIKPAFFKHEELFDLEQETRLPMRVAFAGLWTQCDREGRFLWRPRTLKSDILPYDDVDFSRVLDALMTRGFVVRYEVDGVVYGMIPSWGRHQVVNNREKVSGIPAPELTVEKTEEIDASSTRRPRVVHATGKPLRGKGRGKGTGKGTELIPSHEDHYPRRLGAADPPDDDFDPTTNELRIVS